MSRSPAFFSPRLDKKVRPQDDLFAHANNPWIKANPIPPEFASWMTHSALDDRLQYQLKAILEKLAKKRITDPGEKKLRAFWQAGMDRRRVNALGADPIMEELARIDAIGARTELPALIGRLHGRGVSVFWEWYVDADLKRSKVNILNLFQRGLGLPDRDYYFRTDAATKKIRAAYPKAIARHLRLAGWNAREAASAAEAAIGIEERLAEASLTATELRDFNAQYHRMGRAQLGKTAPGIDWKAYFDAIGAKPEHARTVVVWHPKFMKECASILRRTPLADIKAYLSWHLVSASAAYLSDDFADASFAFYGKILSGRKQPRPRWKRVITEIDGMVGELLGQRYVKEHFPESAKRRVNALIDDLFAVYRARMTALPWMSVKTMVRSIEKLSAMGRKVGYPDTWRSFAAFKPDESSYLAMHWAGMRFLSARLLKKLGKPVDLKEWYCTPQTVNAYYLPTRNEINFPAGFLQPPFFDPNWDDALNYGSIGAVIGHELTHGFDDQGAGFDKDGNLRNWWAKADKDKFTTEAKKLAKQFGKYVVIDKMRCNGELTLGENIADLGGVAIAYEALVRHRKGRMDRKTVQRFFIGYAQSWAGSLRPADMRRRLITDPHAPNYLRVNAVVSNLPEFHDAFDVKPGDKLYRKPGDRVSIW